MAQERQMKKSETIALVAAELDGPISLEEFVERVLAIWPSAAKNPQAGVRQTIRDYEQGKTLVFLDKDTLLPMRLAMEGVRLRVRLAPEEVERGLWFVQFVFQFLLPENFLVANLQLVDEVGHTIPVEVVRQHLKATSIFGSYQYERDALNLGWWYGKHQLKGGDSVLVTILDWQGLKLGLQPETEQERQRHQGAIEHSNRLLADMLFEMLEASHDERLWARREIPTVYARLKDKMVYPADHWLEVLERDPRMKLSGFGDICYADARTWMDDLFDEEVERPSSQKGRVSAGEAEQVYRFKAYLAHRKGLWRRIEIQGGQTLGEFDRILRDAFEHDTWDHLSGFWQRVRRGNSKRFREVDLGSINPFGDGEAAEVEIASIGLKPGDTLKWVYDFGDWIEHRLELEAVGEAEAAVTYPRVVEQNKPRYEYCVRCQEQGRKTIAAYYCYECSDGSQKAVLLCL